MEWPRTPPPIRTQRVPGRARSCTCARAQWNSSFSTERASLTKQRRFAAHPHPNQLSRLLERAAKPPRWEPFAEQKGGHCRFALRNDTILDSAHTRRAVHARMVESESRSAAAHSKETESMSGPQSAANKPFQAAAMTAAVTPAAILASESRDDSRTNRPTGSYRVVVSEPQDGGDCGRCFIYRNDLLVTQTRAQTGAAALSEARRNVRNSRGSL